MAEFASKGVGDAGLATGIIGTTLGVLNGGLGNILGGIGGIGNVGGLASAAMQLGNQYVTQKEMQYIQQLNEERVKNAILTSEQNTEIKIADVYERIMTKVNANQREQDAINREQAVYNGVNTATLGSMRGQIDQLYSLTALHIPADKVCPTPMEKYNSWTAPTT